MGNRALIAPKGASVGVYLHWNGGRDSVEAFLKYAELLGLRGFGKRSEYDTGLEGLPGFLAVLVNFFGNNGQSVYLEACDPDNPAHGDPGDNGVYVVEGWDIVGRYWWGEDADEQRAHSLGGMLRAIDKEQPEDDRLGAFLDGEEVPTDSLEVGDRVYVPMHFRGSGEPRYKAHTVLGHVGGVPYVDRFEGQDNAQNPNAHIRAATVRLASKGQES